VILPKAPQVDVAVIGAGPAGLMAAEVLVGGGADVRVYDAMPSVGRKFLMAGRGGLNLTHSEALPRFLDRYGKATPHLKAAIEAFPPVALRDWSAALGQPTFVGSSGRVFPQAFKASPLLRAWLRRLDASGVQFALWHRWTGWDADRAPSRRGRRYWRWVALVGRGSDRTAPGPRILPQRVCGLRHSFRPTAALPSRGPRYSAIASKANR
jgi:predicted flavoprotein YhiN